MLLLSQITQAPQLSNSLEAAPPASSRRSPTTPPIIAVAAQRAPTFDLAWRGTPLLVSLQRLAQSQQTQILLDRRIDPQQPIDFVASHVTFADALTQLGQPRGWQASSFCAVNYFGPAATADRVTAHFSAQRKAVHQLPREAQSRWQRQRVVTWPTPAEPRQLLRNWAHQSRVRLVGDEQIPFDLWSAQSWPALNLLEQATLLLAGFDLGVQVTPTGELHVVALKIDSTPADANATPHTNAPHTNAPHTNAPHTNAPHANAPHANAPHANEQPTPAPVRSTNAAVDRSLKRFTLTVKNQKRSAILGAVAKQAELQFKWETSAEPYAGERVSLSVKNLTLDELLLAVFAGSPCRAVARGTQYEIHARP